VTFEISAKEIDLVRSVTCGQLFRFCELGDGVWEGVDGDYWYRFEAHVDRYKIESNADASSFTRLFRLDEDEDELAALFASDPELNTIFEKHRLVRMARPSNPVEALFTFLCSSNNHLQRIGGMVRSLAAFGEPFDDHPSHRFPSIARLALIEEHELRHLRFGYRARFITEVARQLHLAGGEEHLRIMGQRTYSDKMCTLLTFPGVGNKLADCISLYAFDDGQAVPIDVHIWRISTQILCPEWCGKSLTPRRYKALGNYYRERFGKHAARVQQLLFLESLSRC